MTAPRLFDRLPPEAGLWMQVWAERVLEKLEGQILAFSLSQSWTLPSSPISAADVGSDVTITIAAHRRIYGDGAYLDVAGAVFTGKAFTIEYAFYYDDATRSDTTPDIQITTNLEEAQANYVEGRHLLGSITTPANGDPPTSGGVTPPGWGGGGIIP